MSPDDINDSIAAQEPGFGGSFTEGGNLIVWAKDVTRGGPIRGQLVRMARLTHDNNHAEQFARANIVVRRADYSVADLNRWREAIEGVAASNWHATDVDEQANRIWIAVESTSDIAILRNAATTLGIPQQAINVEVVQIRHTSAQYLNGYNVSPIGAGVAAVIGATYSGASNLCTIGMIDTVASTPPGVYGLASRGFITAYHCIGSATYGWAKLPINSTPTYDTLGRGENYLGLAQDPHSFAPGETKQGWTCPYTSSYYNCTFADVALFFLDSSIATKRGYLFGNVNTTVSYGVIAPTIDSVAGWGTSGSLQIDSTRTLEMEGENGSANMYVGDVIHKIGAGTGHTYGAISRTCINVLDNLTTSETYNLLCQMVGTYYSGPGDSGAPVYYNPIIPFYEGISWGYYANFAGVGSIFSPVNHIHMTLDVATRMCFYCNSY